MAARQAAIEEKKCTAEEFDEAVRNTGESFFRQLTTDLASANVSVQALETLCDEKFGRDSPNSANLKKAREDLQDAVREFWKPPEKKEQQPDAPPDAPAPPAPGPQTPSPPP